MLRPNMRSLFTYILEFLLKAKPQAEGDLVTTQEKGLEFGYKKAGVWTQAMKKEKKADF